MRLITAECNDEVFVGAWIDNDRLIVDLSKAARQRSGTTADAYRSMQSLIEAGPRQWDHARTLIEEPPEESLRDSAECRLLAPLPTPLRIRDYLCFEEHLVKAFEAAKTMQIQRSENPARKRAELEKSGAFSVPNIWYKRPLYYNCSPFAVCGPDTDVVWPAYSQVIDYELELAAVIGGQGKDVTRERAKGYIFGYTIFNDFSARDEQTLDMQGGLGPGKGKDFDNANVFGPCIVTADEISDPYSLSMIARVNGKERSRGTSASMHYKFEDIIAHASRGESLRPGEIIGSGTVGTGCGLERLQFLEEGDIVELEIEGIGVLRNKVVR